MKTTSNNFNFASISAGLLIAIFIFSVCAGISAWHSTTQAGNESNAVGYISSIRSKQAAYSSAREMGGFASTFAELEEFGDMGRDLIGDAIIFNDYKFTMKVENTFGYASSTYSICADPIIRYGFIPTGKRHFYFSSSFGRIKCTEENCPATASDPTM